MDLNQALEQAVKEGILHGVKHKFGEHSYNSPMQKLIDESITSQVGKFRPLFDEAISGVASDEEFRKELVLEVRSRLAKLLVQRFGGDLEKQVNALKSDPMTRSRITMALEEIVKDKV